MIFSVLHAFSEGLSGHLSRVFSLRSDVVQLRSPEKREGAPLPDKLLVTLVSVERETAAGITFANRPVGERIAKMSPPWQVNLYVLIAALFGEKQYEQGLRLLSESLRYVQDNTSFSVPSSGETMTIEPVNLSINELSNLWSICGGSYRPSILCKIRIIELSGDRIRGTSVPITQKETGL